MFLTLSADDLKEIGLDKFGPRRKMTNAIESWQKETAMLSGGDSGADTSSMSNHVEKLQIELQEKNRQLNQVSLSSNITNLITQYRYGHQSRDELTLVHDSGRRTITFTITAFPWIANFRVVHEDNQVISRLIIIVQ